MSESIEKLNFNIGYLKKSDKEKIRNVLAEAIARNEEMRTKRGLSSSNAIGELQVLVKRLIAFYKVEKSFEGTDRLYSVGREVAVLMKEVQAFDLFERILLNSMQRHYKEKIKQGKEQDFYIGKAQALMAGMGVSTSKKFSELIGEIKGVSIVDEQPELLAINAPNRALQ